MNERILIVGTVPYNKATTARAFEAYFHGWDREKLAQVFSNSKTPVKGHCARLLQITDKRMLQRWFDHRIQVERRYLYEELEDAWKDNDREVGSKVYNSLYEIGSRKTPFIYLMRRFLWKKKFWCNEEFNRWLDEFRPECVFLSFSDDFFIPQIALYVAEKYNIPIVSSIGDDYYFNYKFSLSPLYHIYKLSYRKLIRKIFAHGGSAIYISDKIRDKYNAEFGLHGETVYLTSELHRKPFAEINKMAPVISYFGNIRQGRNESLNDIGYALGKISSDYRLHIYSGQTDENAVAVFRGNPNVEFHGSIPYSQVLEKTWESDIVVIVEGFKKKDINNTRYSLSTKAADSLASGAQIITYGSPECGVIEYMQKTQSSAVCTEKAGLGSCIWTLIEDTEMQKRYYRNAIEMTRKNHNLESSTRVFQNVVKKAMEQYAKQCRL